MRAGRINVAAENRAASRIDDKQNYILLFILFVNKVRANKQTRRENSVDAPLHTDLFHASKMCAGNHSLNPTLSWPLIPIWIKKFFIFVFFSSFRYFFYFLASTRVRRWQAAVAKPAAPFFI